LADLSAAAAATAVSSSGGTRAGVRQKCDDGVHGRVLMSEIVGNVTPPQRRRRAVSSAGQRSPMVGKRRGRERGGGENNKNDDRDDRDDLEKPCTSVVHVCACVVVADWRRWSTRAKKT